jgi:hypothetical protein
MKEAGEEREWGGVPCVSLVIPILRALLAVLSHDAGGAEPHFASTT